MSLTPDQMVTIKNLMTNMGEDQLRDVINHANGLRDSIADRRRKELWGNVVAAIAKYESEVSEIDVDRDGGRTGLYLNKESPGVIFVIE